jgi:hypothetical protein
MIYSGIRTQSSLPESKPSAWPFESSTFRDSSSRVAANNGLELLHGRKPRASQVEALLH